jgi:hypothetical protein
MSCAALLSGKRAHYFGCHKWGALQRLTAAAETDYCAADGARHKCLFDASPALTAYGRNVWPNKGENRKEHVGQNGSKAHVLKTIAAKPFATSLEPRTLVKRDKPEGARQEIEDH